MKLRRLKRALVAVVTAVAMSVGGIAVTAPPAHAAPCSPGDGYMNAWSSSNTCTTWLWSYAWDYWTAVGQCHNTGSPTQVAYIWNDSSHLFQAYTGTGCTGTSGPLYAKTAGPMGGAFYHHVYSIKRMN